MQAVRVFGLASMIALAALTACGGGGGGGGSAPVTYPGGAAGPTASPSPTPGPMSASPSPLNLLTIGEVAPFAVSDPNFEGFITETDSCGGITTIDPTTAQGPSATFNVTAVMAGTCAYTMHDTFGNSAIEQIVVTTVTGGVGTSIRRK